MYPSNVNIIVINSDPLQVLRIDCDAPVTTEQTTATERTTGGTTSIDLSTRKIVSTNALNCDDKDIEAEGKYTLQCIHGYTL